MPSTDTRRQRRLCNRKEGITHLDLPRRPASEMHLRPKLDHLLPVWAGVCSPLRVFQSGKKEETWESAAVALHESVTKPQTCIKK